MSESTEDLIVNSVSITYKEPGLQTMFSLDYRQFAPTGCVGKGELYMHMHMHMHMHLPMPCACHVHAPRSLSP